MGATIKTVFLSLLIIAVGIAGFLALKATKPTPPEKEVNQALTAVRVMEVKKGEYRATVEESGNVEPKTVVDITAEVAGRIVFVSDNLKAGYFAKEGELLVSIDPREYRLNVAQARSQIAQLKAERAQLEQERANILRNLEVEQRKLKLAQSELERKMKLLDSGSLSQSEVDKQEIETKQVQASVLNQRNALDLLASREDLTDAKLEATEAQLDLAGLKLEKTEIHAPFTGRVHEESVEVGQYVSVGSKLATLYDISAMEVVINVPPQQMIKWVSNRHTEPHAPNLADMPRVNEWMRKHGPRGEVRLLVGSRVFTWPGKVTRLKGSLDQTTRTIPIVVEVKDPFKDVKPGEHPPLLPGMFVEVTLRGKRLENVVKVPRIAVHDGAVYVAEDGKLAIRDVTVELMTREDAIISQGLKNGDLVILSYISVPAPGTRLRVIKETAADEEAH